MKVLMQKLWKDDGGFVVTVELILVATILVMGLVTGFAMLRDSVLAEMADTAQAIGVIDQGWALNGTTFDGVAATSDTLFIDGQDGSDIGAGFTTTAVAGIAVNTGADVTTISAVEQP